MRRSESWSVTALVVLEKASGNGTTVKTEGITDSSDTVRLYMN